MRAEDERRLAPRRKQLARAPGASYSLIRNPDCSVVAGATRSRRSRKFRLGFSNASLDHPWRTALVHSVEYGAVRSNDLVSSFAVRHARLDAARQARDVAELLKSGVDGLIVSAHDSVSLADGLSEAERRGVPVVLVDRGRPDILPHVCFVTCDDYAIGDITARWMAERLRGRGSIVLLPGLFQADPAQRRLDGARAVFARYPGLQVADICWTGWQEELGREIIAAKPADGRETIDGVWCDSGLQAVGSLRAYVAAGRSGAIPPHTGGDLNLAYKLAIRHGVPQAAVDYPPAMGLRAVEALLEFLESCDDCGFDVRIARTLVPPPMKLKTIHQGDRGHFVPSCLQLAHVSPYRQHGGKQRHERARHRNRAQYANARHRAAREDQRRNC